MASLGLPARTNSSSASLNLPASRQAGWSINGRHGVSFAVEAEQRAAVPVVLHAYRCVCAEADSVLVVVIETKMVVEMKVDLVVTKMVMVVVRVGLVVRRR